MIGIPTVSGTWRRELERSRESLTAVNRFWHGLYGKAVFDHEPADILPGSVSQTNRSGDHAPLTGHHSMYDFVGSRVTHF